MEHKEAIRIHAVDRYLLGELTAVEREEFEEHFFSCGECSEDLHMGAILVDNSRAVLREEFPDPVPASPGAPPRPGWRLWWSQVPLAAAIALLAVVGYQNLKVLPEYRRQLAEERGAAVPPQFTVRPAVRGAVPSGCASQRHALLRDPGGRRRAGCRRVQLRDSGRPGKYRFQASRAAHRGRRKVERSAGHPPDSARTIRTRSSKILG